MDTAIVRHAGGIDRVGELADRARDFANAARADATLSAYSADWRHWEQWARGHGTEVLPASAEAVALYITDMSTGLKPATISRRLSAISVAHQNAGYQSPTKDALVRSVMTGIRRGLGVAPKQVAPVTIGEIRKMVARMGNTTIDLRDRAILLLGFAGAFRRSELVSLDVGDLADSPDGLLVTVRRSKRDQEGRGDTKAIPFGSDPETCPVRALRAWLDSATIETGPVFRSVDRHSNIGTARLSDKAVSLVVKRAAERSDLDPGLYAGHSLRAGFVTTAAANGASERAIARQTGHAPGSATMRTYIRHNSAFIDNAVSIVGL